MLLPVAHFRKPFHSGAMNFRRLVCCLLFCVTGSAWSAQPTPKAPVRPNIVYIMADDLGYGDLGVYGQKKIKTPNLDQLAAEGIRFTSCYAGSTVCAPSRCSLLTGLHTGHARIRGNANVSLEASDLTLSEVLKNGGYHTGVIGKWGLGEEGTAGIPTRKGFDDWFGFLNQTLAHNYYPELLWRNEEQFYFDRNSNGQKKEYAQDWFTRSATNYLRINRDRPFFLYLAYTTPHANNEAFKATGNGMEVPTDAPYTVEKWPQPEKNKAAMITRLDADVGMLLLHLRRLGLESNTVVFFTSDNGPHREGGNDPAFFASAGPFRGIKRDLYEGGIRVPMIVRWPGRIKPGSTSDLPWAFWDVLPTFAEIAGLPAVAKTDGISIVPTLLGETERQPRHEFLYWEFHEKGSKQAVRMGDWKAVRLSPGQPLELYDLKSDPGETKNVAEKNPVIISKIEEYLKTARVPSALWPLKP